MLSIITGAIGGLLALAGSNVPAILGGIIARVVYGKAAPEAYIGKEEYLDDEGKKKKRDKVMHRPSKKSAQWALLPFGIGLGVQLAVLLGILGTAADVRYCDAVSALRVFPVGTPCDWPMKIGLALTFATIGVFGWETAKGFVKMLKWIFEHLFTKLGLVVILAIPFIVFFDSMIGGAYTAQEIDEHAGKILLFAIVIGGAVYLAKWLGGGSKAPAKGGGGHA